MKNIHVVKTDKPSRLWLNNLLQGKLELSIEVLPYNTAKHIYITSDEEIVSLSEIDLLPLSDGKDIQTNMSNI